MRQPDRTNTGSSADFHYWAFISYSHRDATWAQWLHHTLESYRIPRELIGRQVGGVAIPPRLFPIFRDRDELASAANLSAKVQEALTASRALLVICSPSAARSPWVNEEVRLYKALGRGDHIFPLIIGGEPNVADRSDMAAPECFPPALRFELKADGTLSDRRAEPIAADAREGKDGRSNARLKLIAGILGVGFDELRRRDAARQRRQFLGRIGAAVGIALAAIAGYLALADTGLGVPGGAGVRRQLDRHHVTLFRPVPASDEVRRVTSQMRVRIRRRLTEALAHGDLLNKPFSIWELAQIAAAIARDPGSDAREWQLVTPILDRMFNDELLLVTDGQRIGWADGLPPRAEAALWVLLALSEMHKRHHAVDHAEPSPFARYLAIAHEIAEAYYPLDDGGWNVVLQDSPQQHYVYTTALALHTLLELRSARLCWRGDCEKLEKMIHDTAGWLVRALVEEGGVIGWRRTLDDDKAPDPDLTLMVYGAVGRAHVDVGTGLPARLEAAALRRLFDLSHRAYYPTGHDLLHQVHYADREGRRQSLAIPTRILWYPWGIEALAVWQRYLDRGHFPPDTKRALERSMGHMLVGLSAEMLRDVLSPRTLLFVSAETAFGLGAAPFGPVGPDIP